MRKLFFLLLLVGPCRQAMASQIVNPGGSGGGVVSPGTFTWTNTFGASFSTITVTSEASAATDAAQYQQLQWLNNANLLSNGGFEAWTYGTSFSWAGSTGTLSWTADMWGFAGATTDDAHVTISKETSTTHDGSAALKLVTDGSFITGDSCDLYYQLQNYANIAGSSVTLTLWINAPSNGRSVTVRMSDGLTNTDATLSGNGAYQQVTSTKFVSASATGFQIILKLNAASSNTFYADSAMLVRGDKGMPFYEVIKAGPHVVGSNSCTVTASSATTSASLVPTNLSCAITPRNKFNRVQIASTGEAQIHTGADTSIFSLSRDGTDLGSGSGFASYQINITGTSGTSARQGIGFTHLDAPNPTPSTTFGAPSQNTYKLTFSTNNGNAVTFLDQGSNTGELVLQEIGY